MWIDTSCLFETLAVSTDHELTSSGWSPDLITTDSRRVVAGSVFVPLRGEHFDGHNFIAQAFARGARVCFCSHDWYANAPQDLREHMLLRVDDTLLAYQAIARQWRRQWAGLVIGVTGSSGKTSTKELLAAVLAPFVSVHRSNANFNNEIGVPLTLLGLRPEHAVCVVEMGMRGSGQIRQLAEIAEPEYGLITQIGTAHLSELGSRENIARAKWELADWLAGCGGVLLAQAEDTWQRHMALTTPELAIRWCGESADSLIRLHTVQPGAQGQQVHYVLPNGETRSLWLTLPGAHQVRNLLLCLGLLFERGYILPEGFVVSPEQLPGRSECLQLPHDITLYNDAYNANPDSMRAALSLLPGLPGQRKIAVLGQMAELGAESTRFHHELGEFCRSLPLELLVVIGAEAHAILDGYQGTQTALFCADNASAADALRERLQAGDTLLFKGSRAARLEEVINALRESPNA
jgi:UDP-N-acetylmuramoyl-tripeptide--D-alanyl-D-alanine ligase